MGFSQAEKAENHERILDLAARQIRAEGIGSISVAKLMQDAGLTHGGFYGHFASRDELIAEATERAFSAARESAAAVPRRGGEEALTTFVKSYLSRSHRDAPAEGCAFSALAGELRHAAPELRHILTEHLDEALDRLAGDLGVVGDRRKAIWLLATLTGAINLSRAVDDPALADEILREVRAELLVRLAQDSES